MGCFSPNFIVKHKLNPVRWLELKHRPNNMSDFKVMKDKPYEYCYKNRESMSDLKDYFKDWNEKDYELIPIPCGNCIGCRLDYSRDWATRCLLEAEQYKYNYFITLTYDDEHLPIGSKGNATLVPEDFSNFLKRLRIYYKRHFNHDNIRFFGCGEYGDMSLRPHYHIILFNLPIPDLTPEFKYVDPITNKQVITKHCANGVIYYYSDIIHDLWNKGNVVIGECSYQSCAYTARYVVKKLKGKSSEAYATLGVVDPFCRMSRKPGIAFNYYFDNKENIYEYDSLTLATNDGARILPPPRYFNKMYEIENELRYYQVKEARKRKGEDYLNTLYENTNLHYSDYLECLEEKKQLQISSLGCKLY